MRKMLPFIFPDKKTLTIFLFSLFILLSLLSIGFYLNDEMEQGVCFYNLLHGHITIEEIPEYYYVTQSGLHMAPRFAEYGGHKYIAASHGVAIFSLPFYYFLLGMDAIFNGISYFFVIFWGCLIAVIACLAADIFISKGRRELIKLMGIGVAVILTIVNIIFIQPIDFTKWGPVISIQFMSIVYTSFGLVVLFRLLRNCFNERIAFFGVVLLLLSSPVTFWGIGQKYHALNLSLFIFALAAFYFGKTKAKESYHLVAYVFAGLAIWVQLFSGIVILLTLFLVDLFTIKRKRVKNLVKILAVILISLTPYFVENYVIYNNPLYPGYIAKGNKNVIPPSPPEIKIFSPKNGEITKGEICIWYKVSDNTENTKVDLLYNGSNLTIYEGKEKEVRFHWNLSQEGITILRIVARNWRSSTEKNVSVVVDKTPPVIKIISPLENCLMAKKCKLQVIASEDANVSYKYSKDGVNWIYIGNTTEWFRDFIWNISHLQGKYFLEAIAFDRVGLNSSDVIKVEIDNTKKKAIMVAPQDGEIIGGNYLLKCSVPHNITKIVYEFYEDGQWKLIGIDESPCDPFIWNTSKIIYYKTKIKAIAYGEKGLYGIDEHATIIDNRKVFVRMDEPYQGEKVKDFVIIKTNTSDNALCLKYLYSTDNKSWLVAGYALPNQSFLLPLNNLSGKVYLKCIAFSRTKRSEDYAYIYVTKEKNPTLLAKIGFILKSIRIAFVFFKDLSIMGDIKNAPIKLYRSFFDARDTDSSFSFITFVPFFVLSFFSPIFYIKRKTKINLMEQLMIVYIITHLFFFTNMSTQQGGGYDVRFYLPLHIPFLYFSLVTVENFVTKRSTSIHVSYLFSLFFLFPALIWSAILTNHLGSYYLTILTRTFAKSIIIVLVIVFTSYMAVKKRMNELSQLIITFIGISLFVGTWILILTMIVYSRGIYGTYNNGINFSMMIPIMRLIQQFLQALLR